jgi:hypothetical protein
MKSGTLTKRLAMSATVAATCMMVASSALARYVQSDPIGLDGGINTYNYVGGNPLRGIDMMGLNCSAPTGGMWVTCNVPDGPTIRFPRPSNWPDYIGPGESNYHHYEENVWYSGVDRQCLEDYLRNHPTPGVPNGPASSSGTPNNATPPGPTALGSLGAMLPGLVPSPVRSYVFPSSRGQVVVNVTQPGHPLHPGYVARYDEGGHVRNTGEGLGWLQGRWSPFGGLINNAWQGQNDAAIAACSCRR